MSQKHVPNIHASGADHARVFQQGQGYQFNAEKVYLGTLEQAVAQLPMEAIHWPPVREWDPLDLGVHRAPISDGNAVPPYVERDVDASMAETISTVLGQGGLLLIRGDSTAGKTRCAYQLLQRYASDRRLFRPEDGNELRLAIPTLLTTEHECVVWLDDLERYLGPDGLTPGRLIYLKRAQILLVATMRGEQYRRYIQTRNEADEHDASDFRRIADQSHMFALSRQWTENEIERAAASRDNRIQAALDHVGTFGISEYLAAGPLLKDEWEMAWEAEANPRGASLVAAAVDCARAGFSDPINTDLLIELHLPYLERAGGQILRPESIEQALDWASRRRLGVTSLLIPNEAGSAYRAFEYLPDACARIAENQPVPDEVWIRLHQHAGDHVGQLFSLAFAASQQDKDDIELLCWESMADTGSSEAVLQVGHILRRRGSITEAIAWYERAVDLGDSEGWTQIGLLYERAQDVEQARDYFGRAADVDNGHAALHLANVLHKTGDLESAEAWSRRAAALSENSGATAELAAILGDTGRVEEAEEILRTAVASGDKESLCELGILFDKTNRLHEARQWWEQGASVGVGRAAGNLAASYARSSDVENEELWWRKAIELGEEDAQLNLAILLADQGSTEEAEQLFQEIVEEKIEKAAFNYAVFLAKRDRLDEAERWARVSAGEDEKGAAKLLARILMDRNQVEQSELWLRRAVEEGDVTAQALLGERLLEKDDREGAKVWFLKAAEAGEEQAACALGTIYEEDGKTAEAMRWYQQSYDAGHAHAACRHGSLLMISGSDPELAAERFEAAYRGGHRHGASMLESVRRSQGRLEEAARWFRLARDNKQGPRRTKKKSKNRPKKRRR